MYALFSEEQFLVRENHERHIDRRSQEAVAGKSNRASIHTGNKRRDGIAVDSDRCETGRLRTGLGGYQ